MSTNGALYNQNYDDCVDANKNMDVIKEKQYQESPIESLIPCTYRERVIIDLTFRFII